MKLPQFTTGDLLLNTGLVAIGVALIALVDKSEPVTLAIAWAFMGLWYLDGALIGSFTFAMNSLARIRKASNEMESFMEFSRRQLW